MTPLRIIILAILIYILYRLITGPRRKNSLSSNKEKDNSIERDVLVEDPVCHSYVPKKEAVRGRKDGKTYYFCSEECARIFFEEDNNSSKAK